MGKKLNIEEGAIVRHAGKISTAALERKIAILEKRKLDTENALKELKVQMGTKIYGTMSMAKIRKMWDGQGEIGRHKMAVKIHEFGVWLEDLEYSYTSSQISEYVFEEYFDSANNFGIKASEFFEDYCKK